MRKNARQRRALITPEAREEYAVMAAENAVLLLERARASVPMIYVATPEELGTWPLMDRLLDRGYYPVFPVMSGEEIIPVMWERRKRWILSSCPAFRLTNRATGWAGAADFTTGFWRICRRFGWDIVFKRKWPARLKPNRTI